VSFAKEYHVARAEAEKAFNNASVYIEKYIKIHGISNSRFWPTDTARWCILVNETVQFSAATKKLIEESLHAFLTSDLRKKMGKAAVRAAAAAEYENAGTSSSSSIQKGEFYFIEMNTRIQVEHPVTEEITGH